MNIDADVVINDLLEQNKNLTLQNAVLRATIQSLQSAESATPPEVERNEESED